MKILGIETSCDETAAAVVEDGRHILSNVVVSQIDLFAAYGGVIPEVAARSHLEVILPVIDKALSDAHCDWPDLDAIAVTYAPGLLGSLLIGTLTARTLAILHAKPLYTVHHLKSHVYANWLDQDRPPSITNLPNASVASDTSNPSGVSNAAASNPPPAPPAPSAPRALKASKASDAPGTSAPASQPAFPLIALVVSGGHTQLLAMTAHDQFKIIGTTRDDAVGECFDKVAKILGLPYPGGPAIAKAARGELPPSLASLSASSASSSSAPLASPLLSSAPASSSSASVRPGDPTKYPLPHPQVAGLDFSFSGLKTAVLRAVQRAVDRPISFPSHALAPLLSAQQVADFAASFQKTAVDILVAKLQQAVAEFPTTTTTTATIAPAQPSKSHSLKPHSSKSHPSTVENIVLAGGVAANAALRAAVSAAFPHQAVWFPAASLAGDNGAMVAAAAFYEIQAGVRPADPYKVNIYPRISIES